MTIIPLIALVTAIKGVCNECDTFEINCQPTNTANINTVKCCMNSGGANFPTKNNKAPTTR